MPSNVKLLFCIVLLFSQIIVTYFSFPDNVFVQALPPESISTSSATTNNNQSQSSVQITAGKIQNLAFKLDLSNPNSNPGIITLPETLSDIAISVIPQSSSVKIIGPTTWSIPHLDGNSSQTISTKVYASPSIIGSPVFFTVDVQYIKNGQERKTNSFDIGAVVVGDINIEANNLAVRYIGNTPNLVGNLLNKGNTPALFTNLQVLSVSPQIGDNEQQIGNKMSQGSSQFLGTLPVNTPTPFSIPLSIDSITPISGSTNTSQTNLANYNHTEGTNNSTKSIGINTSASSSVINNGNYTYTNPTGIPTTYKIPLKITYSDELRNSHELIVNKSIPFELLGDSTPNTQSYYSNNGNLSIEQNDNPQLESVLNNGFVDAYWAEGIPSTSGSNNNVNVNSENSSSGTTVTTTTTGTVQQQREVGPGEGQAILAVVLTNTAFSDIAGITGYLTLPSGFSSPIPLSSLNTSSPDIYSQGLSPNLFNSSAKIVTRNNNVKENFPVIASINDVVKAGQTYTLYFKVNVLKEASVGPHTAVLRTYYFKTPDPEIGAYRVQTTGVPFVLPGKVILDVSSSSTDLTPGEANHVKLQIRNKGTADANNVVATLGNVGGSIITSTGGSTANGNNSNSSNTTNNNNLNISSSTPYSKTTGNIEQASSLGSRVFDLGTISANSVEEIDATILPSFSAGESLQNLNLQLSFTDATGDTKSSSEEVGFRVLPNPPEAGLSVNPNFPQDNLNKTTENKQTTESSGLTSNNNSTNSDSGLSVKPARFAGAIIKKNDMDSRINLASLQNQNQNDAKDYRLNDANYTKGNLTSVRSSALVKSNTALYKNVAISDIPNAIGNKKPTVQNSSNVRGDNSITITAGNESDLNFTITNNNRYPIIDAVVSLASQSGSISISGPSKWNLQRLDPGSHQIFPTTVFASKSMIGNPATFDVGVQYIMNGRARNDTFDIGAKVIGDIKVDVSDLGINYIAGTPNLIGNLLNKGNTVALFTTVQLLNNSNTTNPHYGQQNKGSNQDGLEKNMNSKTSAKQADKSVKALVSASNLPSYLGDLQDDSPLPFSIPLLLQNNSSPGTYPVSLKITYNDDLRNSHQIILNSSVELSRPKERSGGNENQDQGILGLLVGNQYSLKVGQISLSIPLIIIIVIICLLTLIVLKRRSNVAKIYTSSRASKEDNFFLDEKNNGNKNPGTESAPTSTTVENRSGKGSGIPSASQIDDTSEMNKKVDSDMESK
ncbi:MAG TPA: hypothetical protein VI146_01320 [Nitrososphaeraceae archaeon]